MGLRLLNPMMAGHANAYVRSGSAAAIAEAVEHWPQAVQGTVNALQEFYREKASLVLPHKVYGNLSYRHHRRRFLHLNSINM
jgi:hypothetical protein